LTKPDVLRPDRGLLYAEACFETFRVIDGRIFAWRAHMERLRRGLAAFGIGLPPGLKMRCLEAAGRVGRDALLRLTVTGGEAPWGLAPPEHRRPGIYVQAMPYRPRPAAVLRTYSWPAPPHPRLAKFTADYAETLRILHAAGASPPVELLACDAGRVRSGLTANVLIHRDGSWWTPGPEGILPGIVRGYLLRAGVLREAACPLAWLRDCTAMALTNSGAFIRPVAAVDGRGLATSGAAFAALWRTLAGRPGVPRGDACA